MKSLVKTLKLTKNKYLEIQLDFFSKDDWELFKFFINYSLKGDHVGFKIEISLYHIFNFNFIIYDHRHWNWEKNCWESYDNQN